MPSYASGIPDSFPNLYSDEWKLGMQQLGSRLESYVNTETIQGDGKRYQILKPVDANAVAASTGSLVATTVGAPLIEHRWLKVAFKDSAHFIDRRDAIQLGSIGSPHSQILRQQLAAAGRDRDKVLIDGIRGSVQTGKAGATLVTLPTTQTIATDYVSSGTAAVSSLTFDKMLEIIRKFGVADVTGQDIENQSDVTLIISHNEIPALLRETKFTSTDYQALRMLNTGAVVNLMGIAIKAVNPALLPTGGSAGTAYRSCYAFARSSVVFGIAEAPQAWVDELPNYRHDVQLRTEWGWGATRLYDEGVLEVRCSTVGQ
jgi:hypothetical protein